MDESLIRAIIDKLIDDINEKIEDNDVTQVSLSEKLNVHKNLLNLYLNKKRSMPLRIAIGLAILLEVDITKVCGIKTKTTAIHKSSDDETLEFTLSDSEVLFLKELRKTKSNAVKERAIQNFTDLIRLMNW